MARALSENNNMNGPAMKAAQFEPDGKFHLIEKAVPHPTGKQVLIRVSACGICGTDSKIIQGLSHAKPPVILGHEFCGVVLEGGAEVKHIKKGDYVAVDPNIICGFCLPCRSGKPNLCENLTALGVDIDGGFARYCLVPESQCYTVPQRIPPEYAALAEPLSCALYGLRRLNVKPGHFVGIVGGGFMGTLVVQLVLLQGASGVIVLEPDEQRRQRLKQIGIKGVFSPAEPSLSDKIREITGEGCDRIMECAGKAEAVRLSLDILRPGGTLVIFGVSPVKNTIPMEPYDIYRRDLTIRGSFLNPFTFSGAIDLIVSGKIDLKQIDIRSFSLNDMDFALRHHINKKSMKVIINP